MVMNGYVEWIYEIGRAQFQSNVPILEEPRQT
jgi:hypothetical protein